MGKYEESARLMHKHGNTCSYSIYNAFLDDYELDGEYPKPRSIDGKCGAVLTTEKILKELGMEEYIEEYEKEFLEKFGYVKCVDLMKNDRRCNDYIGFSANKIEEIINKEGITSQ